MDGWKTRHYLLFPMILVCSFFGECGSEMIDQKAFDINDALFLEKSKLGRKYNPTENSKPNDFKISSNRQVAH